MRLLSIIFVTFASLLLVCGCGPAAPNDTPSTNDAAARKEAAPAPKEVVIGGLFPLTGAISTFGESSRNGMMLAVAEVNAAGGIKLGDVNVPVRAVYEDTEGVQEKTVNAAEKLLHLSKVQGIIGEVASSNSLAAAPLAQTAQVPMISNASTNPAVTQVGDFIFRACFLDSFQGQVMAKFAYGDLGKRRAAVLYDNASDYSKGLSEFFQESWRQLGGEVVAVESFSDEAQTEDFKPQLTNIKAAAPDFLYVPTYYTGASAIIKQARELGLDVVAGGGDGWDSPKLAELGGPAVNGNYFSNHFSMDEPRPEVQSFVKTYREKFGADPDALASLAYDAAKILMTAMRNAASTDGVIVRNAIQGIIMEGVTGRISFDQQRNPVKSAVILTLADGKQQLVTRIEP